MKMVSLLVAHGVRSLFFRWSIFLILACGGIQLSADQVQMQNGDTYTGSVVSMDANIVVMKSDVLGTVQLPRSKVLNVLFGATAGTNVARLALPTNGQPARTNLAFTNSQSADISNELRQLGNNTNLIQQIQAQFLGDAGPEANNKFNQLLGGLATGKIDANGLRQEAKVAADQLKELKKQLGDDAGSSLDGYLTILENFLHETTTAAAAPPSTNIPPVEPKIETPPTAEKK